MRIRGGLAAVAATAMLAGCAAFEEPKTLAKPVRINQNPFPSTYAPYPGTPTVIRNATVFDGEGGRIDGGTVVFADGRIQALGGPELATPAGAVEIDGTGKFVTPGVIDVHSHLGVYPSPSVESTSDGNEMTGPVHPDVWAEHSIWPQDAGFSRALVNGGVTTVHILPGSGNLFGGRGVTLKNVPARTMQAMKFPAAPYTLKMACGQNPARSYGSRNQMPQTRMGNIALIRETWVKAKAYDRKWDAYDRKGGDMPARDLSMETLRGVLDGKILIQNHCYRAEEMAMMLDVAKEAGYKIRSFHHATDAYKVADLLKANGTCASVWADWYGFKIEAYDGIRENLALLEKAGACGTIHSDDANGIQRLNQEVAKALAAGRRMGLNIADERAWAWLGINAAWVLGVEDKVGSLKPGKMADVVLWNGNPFSVYTRPEKVWVDGAMLVDTTNPRMRPVSDFELGQPGEGDVK